MLYGKDEIEDIGSAEQGLLNANVERIIGLLNALPPVERSTWAMKIASKLLEYAAYESAGHQNADFVAELVDASAKIENSACEALVGSVMSDRLGTSRLH